MGPLTMTDFDLDAKYAKLWDRGAALAKLREAFPSLDIEATAFRGEDTLLVPRESLLDVLAYLKDEPGCEFDFLTDVTAVHWPKRKEPFEVVYHLYSMPRNVRLRVKCLAAVEPSVPSVVALWPTANWLERECYDMFGIDFVDHPELSRILMPDDYAGWPLRKEFPLKC